MDIKELVQVKAEGGCVGCVAYPEMVKAIEKKGNYEGTLCDRLGNACLRGIIWVNAAGALDLNHEGTKDMKVG